MPQLVNPMDALKSFEPALRAGQITVQPGDVDPTVFVHMDSPLGQPRWTYVQFSGQSVRALAIIVTAEPYEGLTTFQLGYAVPQHLRKRGYAKVIANAAISELTAGLRRNGVESFAIEAIVGTKNLASQSVAQSIFGPPIKEGADTTSDEPIFQYVKTIGI